MSEYEQNILNLFSQLAEAMKAYEAAMRDRAFPDYRLDEDASPFQIRLNNHALRICDLIDKIVTAFDEDQCIEKTNKLSKEIRSVVEYSVSLKTMYSVAKRENVVTPDESKSYNNVLSNLQHLDRIIKEYNNNFDKKLLTIAQARQQFNEEIDEMFQEITGGNI